MRNIDQTLASIALCLAIPVFANSALASPELRTIEMTAGKSMLMPLDSDASRVSIANAEVADVILLSPKEIYLLGKKTGTTNLIVWSKNNLSKVFDLRISLDTVTLKSKILQLVPTEKNIQIDSLGDAIVLSGKVSDPIKIHRIVQLSEIFSGTKKVINLIQVEGSQQVMLEVKVAEVSKTLMDELGFSFNASRINGAATFGLISSFLSGGTGSVNASNSSIAIKLDAEIKKGLVKILAEPTITAISGQEGSFLAGGKIFIPIPQAGAAGTSSIALEEREFGVGLKFVPTVLEDGLINLKVTPEVSELSQIGTTVTTSNGQSSVLPSITTRRASTTVQLRDGESFVIGGLIKSNVSQAIKAFPVLGEIPILGALFRSSSFQTDKTELVFVVTPHLAKPTPTKPALPTDHHKEPTRSDFLLKGQLEGESKAVQNDQ